MSYVDANTSGVKGVSTNVGYSTVEQSHTIPQGTYTTSYANDVQNSGYQYTSGSRAGQYVGGQTTYTTTGPVQTGYSTTQYGGATQYGNGYAVGGTYGTSSHTAQRTVAEDIPVESRIEYIPFEKKYIEYDRVERV